MSSKNILVSGGAGFLGSHLCDRLLADGHRVICLDNFYTGSRENVAHLAGDDRFQLLAGDVNQLPSVLDCAPLDQIFHMACPASPVHYQRNPVETLRTCVFGTYNMLELAMRTGARLLIASTSEVYGDPEQHPQQESYWGNVNPIGPRSCYDEGKRCGEAFAVSHAAVNGTEVRLARIFNTYGPRMDVDDGRVVSNFVVQAIRGEGLTVYGDGKQTRSFCYVSDLVEGFIRLMASDEMQATPVNLGNPGEFTILELADLVRKYTGSASDLSWQPLPKDDPTLRRPDITVARERLGWEPTIPLEEGLERTIAYFRERLS
jgi:UDP-glucuronate decarboxylase